MRLAAACLALAAPVATIAQIPNSTAAETPALSEQMRPLAPLIGDWRGTGWMFMPSGQREEFESWERVTPRLSGNALLVEGRHTATDTGHTVHDAMAMITWNPQTSTYRFRSALASGVGGDFSLEVTPGRFAWTMDPPRGRIRYVAEFDDETWIERGTITGADGNSRPFFEMRLRRE